MIKIENLVHKYTIWKDENTKSEKTVLDGISLDIPSGQFVAILGPNGSGKSTLAKHLNVLLLPNEGTVWINGKDTHAKERLWEIRSQVVMVFQNPDNQIVTDFVWHELAFGLENMALPVPVIRRRVAEMAAFFGMVTWFRSKTTELSGGQKQLMNLASALAMGPKLLILDEPTSNMDTDSEQRLQQRLAAVSQGRTLILVPHRLSMLRKENKLAVM